MSPASISMSMAAWLPFDPRFDVPGALGGPGQDCDHSIDPTSLGDIAEATGLRATQG